MQNFIWPCNELQTQNIDWMLSVVKKTKEEWKVYKQKIDDMLDTIPQQITSNVNSILNEWKNDGTMDSIINEEIFGDLNTKINNLETSLNELTAAFSTVQKTAEDAKTASEQAVTEANSAKTAAAESEKNAASASESATSAANDARDALTASQSASESAKTSAESAKNAETNASSAAINANAAANSAESIANSVLTPRIIFIGDSYAQGYSPEGNVTSWCDRASFALKASSTAIYAQGGAGFNNSSGGKSIFDLIKTAISEHGDYEMMIIGCGANDVGSDVSTLTSKVSEALRYINRNYNGSVYLACIGSSRFNISGRLSVAEVYRRVSQATVSTSYICGCEYALKHKKLFSSDMLHPNSEGQKEIGNMISSGIKGTCGVTYGYSQLNLAGGEVSFTGGLAALQMGGFTTIIFSKSNNTVYSGAFYNSYKCNGSLVTIGDIGNNIVVGSSFTTFESPCILYDGSRYYEATMIASIEKTTLKIGFILLKSDGSDFETLNIRRFDLYHDVLATLPIAYL